MQTLGAAAPLHCPPASHRTLPSDPVRVPLFDDYFLHGKAWWVDRDAPAVVIIHGIGGSTESRYVVRAAVAFHRAGYHVVRLDLRGAGQSIPDVPTLYHAGLSEDYDLVVEHVRSLPRVTGVVILGYSGGGALALKRAGQWGSSVPRGVLGMASVSGPLDYTKVGPWMDSLGRIAYRFHVLRGLTTNAREFARTHPTRAHYRPEDVKRMGSFRDYDGNVIVPMHGFKNVDEYWDAASPGKWLSKIEVPSLLVHAMDDPMVPDFTIEPWLGQASKAVSLEVSQRGGHIGWVSGFDEKSWIHSWANQKVLSFIQRVAPLNDRA